MLVIGDSIMDRFVTVRVRGVAPDSESTLVVNPACTATGPGGAANVANILANMKVSTRFLSRFGSGCVSSSTLHQALGRAGVEVVSFFADNYQLPLKTRYITTNGAQILRVDEHDAYEPYAGTVSSIGDPAKLAVEKRLNVLLPKWDQPPVVVVSDYNKGFLEHETWYDALCLLKQRGCPILVDPPRKASWRLYHVGVSVLKINQKQATDLIGRKAEVLRDRVVGNPVHAGDLWYMASEALGCEGLKPKWLWITLGSGGMVYGRTESDGPLFVKGISVKNPDPCGAGDAALAAFAAVVTETGMQYDAEVARAVRIANLVAATACNRRGVYQPTDLDFRNAKATIDEAP